LAGFALTWQWLLASVAVPIVIGVTSSLATHWLSVRKSRFDMRLADWRKSYDRLLPALADALTYDRRQLRFVYHEFESGSAEEQARAKDEEWAARHNAAMSVIRDVVAKRELAASPGVLKALDALMEEYSRVDPATHSWDEACEAFAAATLAAVDAVREEIPRDV
jgi:hypothetical protein